MQARNIKITTALIKEEISNINSYEDFLQWYNTNKIPIFRPSFVLSNLDAIIKSLCKFNKFTILQNMKKTFNDDIKNLKGPIWDKDKKKVNLTDIKSLIFISNKWNPANCVIWKNDNNDIIQDIELEIQNMANTIKVLILDYGIDIFNYVESLARTHETLYGAILSPKNNLRKNNRHIILYDLLTLDFRAVFENSLDKYVDNKFNSFFTKQTERIISCINNSILFLITHYLEKYLYGFMKVILNSTFEYNVLCKPYSNINILSVLLNSLFLKPIDDANFTDFDRYFKNINIKDCHMKESRIFIDEIYKEYKNVLSHFSENEKDTDEDIVNIDNYYKLFYNKCEIYDKDTGITEKSVSQISYTVYILLGTIFKNGFFKEEIIEIILNDISELDNFIKDQLIIIKSLLYFIKFSNIRSTNISDLEKMLVEKIHDKYSQYEARNVRYCYDSLMEIYNENVNNTISVKDITNLKSNDHFRSINTICNNYQDTNDKLRTITKTPSLLEDSRCSTPCQSPFLSQHPSSSSLLIHSNSFDNLSMSPVNFNIPYSYNNDNLTIDENLSKLLLKNDIDNIINYLSINKNNYIYTFLCFIQNIKIENMENVINMLQKLSENKINHFNKDKINDYMMKNELIIEDLSVDDPKLLDKITKIKL